MQELGFGEFGAEQALRRTGNNFEASVNWLISHPDIAIAVQPVVQPTAHVPAVAPASEEDELALAIALSLQGEETTATPAPLESITVATGDPATETSLAAAPPVAPIQAGGLGLTPNAALPLRARGGARARRGRGGLRGINPLGQQIDLNEALNALLGASVVSAAPNAAQLSELSQVCTEYELRRNDLSPLVLELAFHVCSVACIVVSRRFHATISTFINQKTLTTDISDRWAL